MQFKIFSIGLNKAGTTSLNKALNILGYSSIHGRYKDKRINQIIEENLANEKPILDGIDEFDAYTDFVGYNYFRKLDKAYPNSKYIFTIRDEVSWLASREKHVLRNLKKKNYDGNWTHFDKEANRRLRLNIINRVKEYFKNRKSDILYMNIVDGDNWETLCPFLGVEIPNISFPSANVKSQRSKND